MTRRRAEAFSLVELLLVLSLITIAMSMAFVFRGGKGDRRGMQVRIDADQLASVLRQTRAMAMDQKGIYGVSFNLANAAGSSGRVLNNRDGGHWYRVLGPSRTNQWNGGGFTGFGGYESYLRFRRDWGSPSDTQDALCEWYLAEIQNEFVGPRNLLTKGMVRFLALADEDNGNNRGPGFFFGPTYPRPWFGEWDPSTKRIYTWGGYDPEMKDFGQNHEWWTWNWWNGRDGLFGTISYTGFYYEGDEGVITGCVNPRDRMIVDDTNGNGVADAADAHSYVLLRKDQPRPLINSDWLDAVILFFPDGTARFEDWMHMRHEYGNGSRSTYFLFNQPSKKLCEVGMGDMCNLTGDWEIGQCGIPYNSRYEASHFSDRTGCWYITLAPDAPDDRIDYPTARDALASMMPMIRVGVTRVGEVKVVEVKPHLKPGVTLDDVHKDGWWENRSCGWDGYYNNLLTTADGPCMPAEDFVTPEMLEHRQWWLKP